MANILIAGSWVGVIDSDGDSTTCRFEVAHLTGATPLLTVDELGAVELTGPLTREDGELLIRNARGFGPVAEIFGTGPSPVASIGQDGVTRLHGIRLQVSGAPPVGAGAPGELRVVVGLGGAVELYAFNAFGVGVWQKHTFA